LNEVNVGSGSFLNDGGDVFSEELNNLKGFLMFLKGLDEHEVGITSLFSKSFSLLVDVVSSVVDPSKVLSGDLDLVLDVLSVSGGFVTNLLVRVSDESEILDKLSVLSFDGGVLLVSEGLSINVSLLKVSEETEGGVDGIDGLGLHVEEGGQLVLELVGVGHGRGGTEGEYD
jgi:hypothetical protein